MEAVWWGSTTFVSLVMGLDDVVAYDGGCGFLFPVGPSRFATATGAAGGAAAEEAAHFSTLDQRGTLVGDVEVEACKVVPWGFSRGAEERRQRVGGTFSSFLSVGEERCFHAWRS